jgi:putative transposase
MGQKKIWGRKRHFLVDSLGWPMAVRVEAAHWLDPFGAEGLLLRVQGRLPRLKRIWADVAYQGHQLVSWVREHLQVEIIPIPQPSPLAIRRQLACSPTGHSQIVSAPLKGALNQRWVVERSFAWISRLRRLARDVEGLPACSEAFIALAFSRLVLRRLTASSS